MQKRIVFAGIIVGVCVLVWWVGREGRQGVVNDPEGFRQAQEEAARKNAEDVLSRNESLGGGETEDVHPVSLQALAQKEFNGSNFTVGKKLEENAAYTKYYVTYTSGELTISGTMNVPKGAVPSGGFPVVLTNHGYIDPAVYTNGRGLRREGDYLARNGFVVVHSDYRNHAQSSKDPDSELNIRLGYVEDVINAVYALRAANLEYINKDKVGMLGHSMGGGIAQAVMVTKPGLVDAYVLYAPVSMYAQDSFERWTKTRPEVARKITENYGLPADNPEFWNNVSPATFVSNITEPVRIFHGTNDQDVPLEWSERTEKLLKDARKDVSLTIYPGEPHEFATAHTKFMQSVTEFFKTELD